MQWCPIVMPTFVYVGIHIIARADEMHESIYIPRSCDLVEGCFHLVIIERSIQRVWLPISCHFPRAGFSEGIFPGTIAELALANIICTAAVALDAQPRRTSCVRAAGDWRGVGALRARQYNQRCRPIVGGDSKCSSYAQSLPHDLGGLSFASRGYRCH